MYFSHSRARATSILLGIASALLLCSCQSPADAAQGRGLAEGKFLVAARDLSDPNFAETVVLLTQYDETSASGLIVNQPTRVRLSRIMEELDLGEHDNDPVFRGGPVAVSGVLALIRSDNAPEDALPVFENVYLANTVESLREALAQGTGPDNARVYMGYTGWGPGQLDREVTTGSWHILDGDPQLVFDPDPASLWDRLIKRASVVLVNLLQGAQPRC